MSDTAIQALVQKFAADIEALVRDAAIKAVQSVLSGTGQLQSRPASSTPRAAKAVAKATAKPAVKAAVSSPATKRTGKRFRRSAADLDRDVGRIVAYVRQNPGTNGETARAALAMDKTPWVISIRRAMETGQLQSTGQKRATTYTLPGAQASSAVPPHKRQAR